MPDRKQIAHSRVLGPLEKAATVVSYISCYRPCFVTPEPHASRALLRGAAGAVLARMQTLARRCPKTP